MAAASCIPFEKEATILEVAVPGTNVSAADTHLDAIVTCDAKWTVTLDDESWARIESTEVNSQGGTFKLAFSPNTAEESRRTTILAKSGAKVFSFVLTQGGVGTFFSPRQVTISGAESSTTTFKAPVPWTAEITEGKEWFSLKTVAGIAGPSTLEFIPADANENIGPRSGNVRVHIGEAAFDIPVTQGQKDVIYLEPNANIDMPYEGGEFSILTKSNVTYEVKCSANWIHHAATKALNEATEQFTVDLNISPSTRTGAISFSANGILTTVSVTQEGRDPILSVKVPTISGIYGYNCTFGQNYWNQSCGTTSASGEYSYTFMSSMLLSVYEIGGIDVNAEKGDTFDITVTRQEKAERGRSNTVTVSVVGADDRLMWLRANENAWLIIEKP